MVIDFAMTNADGRKFTSACEHIENTTFDDERAQEIVQWGEVKDVISAYEVLKECPMREKSQRVQDCMNKAELTILDAVDYADEDLFRASDDMPVDSGIHTLEDGWRNHLREDMRRNDSSVLRDAERAIDIRLSELQRAQAQKVEAECVIDPFEALDAEGAQKLYLRIPKYAPFENVGAKDPARGFTCDEARRYIDDALPISGLLSEEDKLPARGWACVDTAVHAMYVVAAHRMRPDRNEYVDEADWNRVKKVYNLINESDQLTCPPTVFGDNPLADISRLRQQIGGIGEELAISHGENFDVLCENERSAITLEQTRYFEPTVSVVGRDYDPMRSEYHAKTFEHQLMSEWAAGSWAVLGKVGAKDEYDRFWALDENESMNPYNRNYDASTHASVYMKTLLDPEDEEIWTEEQANKAQAHLESRVFPRIISNVERGWIPSDTLREMIPMDAVETYAKRHGMDLKVPDAEKSTVRKAAEARLDGYEMSESAIDKEMSL